MNPKRQASRAEASWSPEVLPTSVAGRLHPLVVVIVWTIPGLLSCMQAWATNRLAGRQVDLFAICIAQLPAWYLWAAFTPLLFRLAEKAPPTWPPKRGALGLHAVALVACLSLHSTVIATMAVLLDRPKRPSFPPFPTVLQQAAVSWIPSVFLLYCATIGAAAWMSSVERERSRAKAQAELNEAMATAELNALRSQLHPHFLFNTLNTVAVLVRAGDAVLAERVITQLAAILRDLLRNTRQHETTLRAELELLRRYLEIEHVRFGDRLNVEWPVAGECLNASVPVLLLQPLVENAIRHGIARVESGGTIAIGGSVDADCLTVWVANDGPPAPDVAGGDGIGLANTRRRLTQLYGDEGRLVMQRTDSRTVVEVKIPYHVHESSTDGPVPLGTAPVGLPG
jgi:two-component sensor histidine kinase